MYEVLLLWKAVWNPFYLVDFLECFGLGVLMADLKGLRESFVFGLMRMVAGLGTCMFKANFRLILSCF